MDKYEYNLKLEQIKAFLENGNYKEAEGLADTINWNKIRNINTLVSLGEVYEKAGRYEESREILLNAYDRSPIGRNILYRLTEVAIKMKDFDGAMEYYEEFVEIAPHDAQKYILKYELMKAKESDIAELIVILEEFKEQEYMEEWAYELAYLYHKAGQIEKCVDACDELVLWFGDGDYVERALELKMLYQPLTKLQEEKYKSFCHAKEEKNEISMQETERVEEHVLETEKLPQVELNPERFNTVNLEAEIVKGMQELMETAEEKTDADATETVKKMTEEIPYLQVSEESKKQENTFTETKNHFDKFLGEDADGQMRFVVSEKANLERQITGQINIADVLAEWEKKSEEPKGASVRKLVFQESENIMDRLNGIIPTFKKSRPSDELPKRNQNITKNVEISKEAEGGLTEEQKAIFSYFVPVQDMEEQLCKALEGISARLRRKDTASTGNLLIQGNKGCGKTVLATSIVKVLQKEGVFENGKVGKIEAKAFNQKDIAVLLRKVSGGCLIIESAGELEESAAITLSHLLEQDRSGFFVILEDSAIGIKRAMSLDEGFAAKFTENITVPIFTNDELVSFAKSYANELGYKIDAVAILALHNRISSIEKLDQETRLEEVKEIIDEAIKKEANSGIRKAFNILTAKRYTDDERIVLTEKDFE